MAEPSKRAMFVLKILLEELKHFTPSDLDLAYRTVDDEVGRRIKSAATFVAPAKRVVAEPGRPEPEPTDEGE